jgi:hypothetical protein
MVKASLETVSPFLSYLQKRMDFIAQVATSPPSWCLVTDCDELINDFNNQFCLVNNIIRSHQGTFGGPNFEPLLVKKYDAGRDHSPDLDIPHGEIGAQAFYTILENIIRNTAKYGDPDQLSRIKHKSGDGKLRFIISINNNWDDRGKGWAKDFCEIQIVEMLETKPPQGSNGEAVASKLNRYLGEPLTNPATGVVNPKNWGMKEIKICAAYLRMVKQHEIDAKFDEWSNAQHRSQPPIISVSLKSMRSNPDDPPINLTYTLYLLRPKHALVVRDGIIHREDEFRLAGVEFCSSRKFRQRTEQGATPRHSFLVIPKPKTTSEWDWLWSKLNFLPPRILVVDAQEEDIPSGRPHLSRSLGFINGPLPTTPFALLDSLWTNWVQRWWGDFKIFVRSSLHEESIAEKGRAEGWDKVEEIAGTKWLVFDHSSDADDTELYEIAAFHESFRYGSPSEKMLQKRGSLIKNSELMTSAVIENQTRQRIREAAGLSVAVIDERVWLERDGVATEGASHYKDVSRLTVWKKRRVFLQDTNLALEDFDTFVNSLSPTSISVFDFVIIHQGIIDSVREKTGSNFDAIWLRLERKTRWLVIDSGRGQPEQARKDDLRWVEYSNLAECLVQYAGNKLKLTELLWTLRASSKDGTFR